VIEEAAANDHTIGHRAVRGAVSLTIATYLSILLGIAARKWLAILLAPAIFGIIQASLSFVDLVFSFSAFSFSSAIINVRKNLVKEPLEYLNENIFILTLGLNVILAVAAMGIGVFFAKDLGGFVVLALIGVYTTQRVISAFDTFYTQMLERELDYKRVSMVSLAANITLHTASVLIALSGHGAWSIPVATLLSAMLSFVFDRHYSKVAGAHFLRPQWWKDYRPATAKWLMRFGTNVFFNRLFESWLFRVDNMLVLAFLGTATLGIYAQAFAIAQMPAMALAPIVARVSIATYASIQHDRTKLEEAFRITNFFLIRLLIPAALLIFFTSADIVRLFLSTSWSAGAAPLAALTGFVLTVPLFENSKMLLGAKLKLKEISYVRGAQLAALIVLILSIGNKNVTEVALIVSFVSVAGLLFIFYFVQKEVSLFAERIFLLPVLIGVAVGHQCFSTPCPPE
jgi:teichuronic acid exporter